MVTGFVSGSIEIELSARHEDATAERLDLSDLREECSAASVRHVLIGQHDVEVDRPQLRHRLGDTARLVHFGVTAKRPREEVSNNDVVVDHQYAHEPFRMGEDGRARY